jgi:hypothetical protein
VSEYIEVRGDYSRYFNPARLYQEQGILVFEVADEGYIEAGAAVDISVVLLNLPRKMIAKCQVGAMMI